MRRAQLSPVFEAWHDETGGATGAPVAVAGIAIFGDWPGHATEASYWNASWAMLSSLQRRWPLVRGRVPSLAGHPPSNCHVRSTSASIWSIVLRPSTTSSMPVKKAPGLPLSSNSPIAPGMRSEAS